MCTIGTGRQVGEVVIKLSSILSFVTGLDCIPALGFECDPEIEFIRNDKGRLPYASTCMPTLYLPLSLTEPDIFFDKMTQQLLEPKFLVLHNKVHVHFSSVYALIALLLY